MATALWNSIDKTLLEESGLVHNGDVPIAEPIDMGADKLLASFTREEPQWNALEAEILVEGLEKRIADCERLREKGQDLEREIFSHFLDCQRTQDLARILRKEAADIAHFEPALLKNRTETGPVPEYWEKLKAYANERAEQAEKSARLRLSMASRPGDGNHLVARFEAIRERFQAELKEAYRMARAAEAGLRVVYGESVVRNSVPVPIAIGYLDDLAEWSRTTARELDRHLSYRSETLLVIPVGSQGDGSFVLNNEQYLEGLDDRAWKFELTPQHLQAFGYGALENPRLRGLQPFFYTLEPQHRGRLHGVTVTPPEWNPHSRPRVFVGEAPGYLAETPGCPMYNASIHNLPLLGSWKIEISPLSLDYGSKPKVHSASQQETGHYTLCLAALIAHGHTR